MKKIPKKLLDALLTMNRRYWKTANTDYMESDHALCHVLEKETGVNWLSFANLVDSIIQYKGFQPNASNTKIYEVLRVLGYEVVDDGE